MKALLIILFFSIPSFAATGFKVLNVEQGSIYDRLDLKKGDVVQKCNGSLIRKPAHALNCFKSENIRMEILRDQKIVQKNIVLR